MNIRVDLNYPIKDGTEVVFRSPVDCSQVTGLKVYYPDGSQEFVFADAHGNNVGDIDHLFAEDVVVKVILDVTKGMAFVQNADTNAYLEGEFAKRPLASELGEALYKKVVKPFSLVPITKEANHGPNIAPEDLSTFSATNAIWNGTGWDVESEFTLKTTVTTEANKRYLITFDISEPQTDDNSFIYVSFGGDTVKMFSANDALWTVVLIPTGTESEFKLVGNSGWTGTINGITIQRVRALPEYSLDINGIPVQFNSTNYNDINSLWLQRNMSIGGQKFLAAGGYNTSFGYNAHSHAYSMRWCTAIGDNTQRALINGTGNTAVGSGTQNLMRSGSYNNGYGNGVQNNINGGNWNNAFGNETQLYLTEGCNNVAFGRRAQCALETGNYNTAIGTWAGFTGKNIKLKDGKPDPDQRDHENTITASYQTLVGARSRQSGVQSDYLTTLGCDTRGVTNAIAIGGKAEANGVDSIAIGFDVKTDVAKEVKIGGPDHTFVLGNKRLIFNDDGTVTWKYITGEDVTVIASGNCGISTSAVNYSLNSIGELIISGQGEMKNYAAAETPWYEYRDEIKSVKIEDGVTTISTSAFYNYTSLESVTIGSSVTTIGANAFSGCSNLTSITIPDSVTNIGNSAFSKSGLSSISIPDSVTTIDKSAFYQCPNLASVTIGSGVTRIGASAFYGSSNLTSAVFKVTEGWWRSSDASATSGDAILKSDLADAAIAASRLLHGIYGKQYWNR